MAAIVEGVVAMGKGQEGLGQLAAVHLHGAHHQVEANHAVHLVFEIAMILQHVGYRLVEMGGKILALSHLRIRSNTVITRQRTDKAQEVALGIFQTTHQNIGRDQSSRIDKGIARNAVLIFQLDNRIEGVAGGFLAHPFPQLLAPKAQAESQRIDFRDTLYGEAHLRLGHMKTASVNRCQAHAKLVGVDALQSWNIVGLVTCPAIRFHLRVNIF